MEYTYKATTELERMEIENANKDKRFIEEYRLLNGDVYLTYSDEPTIYETTWEENIENKISILERENQTLKEVLTQIQTSIASLTSLITTLEEK